MKNEYKITIFRKSGSKIKHRIMAENAHEAHKQGKAIMDDTPDSSGCRTVLAKLFTGVPQQSMEG
tara:strand:+ start:609 stop:803 length:195 start_codon:yes stop_codon:yes gene_type:complete